MKKTKELTPCHCGGQPRITYEGDGEWVAWCEGFHQTEVFADTRAKAVEAWEEQFVWSALE